MTVGYIIRYVKSVGNTDEFDGIYLDREAAILASQRYNSLVEEPIILEGNFIQCSPQANKSYYIFQRRPLTQVIFGIYDDEMFFDEMINNIVDLKNKSNKIADDYYFSVNIKYPTHYDKISDPQIRKELEDFRKMRYKELLNHLLVYSDEKRQGLSNLLSNVGAVFRRENYHKIELQIKEAEDLSTRKYK